MLYCLGTGQRQHPRRRLKAKRRADAGRKEAYDSKDAVLEEEESGCGRAQEGDGRKASLP